MIEEAYVDSILDKEYMLPTGALGKNYITEVTKLMNLWVNDLPLKKYCL